MNTTILKNLPRISWQLYSDGRQAYEAMSTQKKEELDTIPRSSHRRTWNQLETGLYIELQSTHAQQASETATAYTFGEYTVTLWSSHPHSLSPHYFGVIQNGPVIRQFATQAGWITDFNTPEARELRARELFTAYIETTTEHGQARQTLRDILKPGDRLTIQTQSTTASGRTFAVFFASERGQILDLTPGTARATNRKAIEKQGRCTIRLNGHGFKGADEIAESLSRALYGTPDALKGDTL